MKKLKDKVDVLRIIIGIRSELAGRFTVQRIGVFGSFAKGDQGSESDVDIIQSKLNPLESSCRVLLNQLPNV